MLLLLIVSFALADYPATPAFPISPGVFQAALINGNYACPPNSTCYSHTGVNCEKGSVCCSVDQTYSNGTCVDQVPLAICEDICCSLNGICTLNSTCCRFGDMCTNVQNSSATCVKAPNPYPTVPCEDCGSIIYHYPNESLVTLAVLVLIFGCVSLVVVLMNSTTKTVQISRVLRKFTPEVISDALQTHPTYFDCATEELIVSKDFHENLTTLRNHFNYTRYYQLVVFPASLGYFLNQVYSSSEFAFVSFSIFILCVALWAGRSIYLRHKLKMYLVAIPKLDKARKEILKTVVVHVSGKNSNPPAYPYEEGSAGVVIL